MILLSIVALSPWSSGKGFLVVPALSNSVTDDGLVEPDDRRPFGNGLRYSTERKFHVRRHVPHLFVPSGPTAIARLIAFVCVDAVNAVLRRWTRSHVFKKCSETIAPFFTDGNTLRPVFGERRVMRILTSTFHAGPHFIFDRSGQSVRCQALPTHFVSQASAAQALSGGEISGKQFFECAAVTATEPVALADIREHGPSAVLSSHKITNIVVHGCDYTRMGTVIA